MCTLAIVISMIVPISIVILFYIVTKESKISIKFTVIS